MKGRYASCPRRRFNRPACVWTRPAAQALPSTGKTATRATGLLPGCGMRARARPAWSRAQRPTVNPASQSHSQRQRCPYSSRRCVPLPWSRLAATRSVLTGTTGTPAGSTPGTICGRCAIARLAARSAKLRYKTPSICNACSTESAHCAKRRFSARRNPSRTAVSSMVSSGSQ